MSPSFSKSCSIWHGAWSHVCCLLQNGFTPLHLATLEGHTDMVALLTERGAVVNCRSLNGLTPLHLAAQEDRVAAAKRLVRHGADTDPQTLVCDHHSLTANSARYFRVVKVDSLRELTGYVANSDWTRFVACYFCVVVREQLFNLFVCNFFLLFWCMFYFVTQFWLSVLVQWIIWKDLSWNWRVMVRQSLLTHSHI